MQIPDSLASVAMETMSEFEVLDMSKHDSHYAAGLMSPLNAVAASTQPPPFLKRQVQKTGSQHVIGNIGEGIGMASLIHLSGIRMMEVTRVRRQKQRQQPVAQRTPDFVVALSDPASGPERMRQLVTRGSSRPAAVAAKLKSFPSRFPVEAKAASDTMGSARWNGLWQLVEYWHSLHEVAPNDPALGYGVLLLTRKVSSAAREVDIHVLAPQDPVSFAASLNGPLKHAGGSKASFMMQFPAAATGGVFVEG
ncbi:hypothetical protein VZQ01_40135 [Myxococcus faecalis]|uniref:hypothetical protein n=1 Tax=Myxococcus faecalis TaxID=3115646 RepID=UPI003CE8A392